MKPMNLAVRSVAIDHGNCSTGRVHCILFPRWRAQPVTFAEVWQILFQRGRCRETEREERESSFQNVPTCQINNYCGLLQCWTMSTIRLSRTNTASSCSHWLLSQFFVCHRWSETELFCSISEMIRPQYPVYETNVGHRDYTFSPLLFSC